MGHPLEIPSAVPPGVQEGQTLSPALRRELDLPHHQNPSVPQGALGGWGVPLWRPWPPERHRGFPKNPRPIMAMSAPVNWSTRSTSSRRRCPVADDGDLHRLLHLRMVVQSACPAYILGPGPSVDADVGHPRLLQHPAEGHGVDAALVQPGRIFTVTGTPLAFTTAPPPAGPSPDPASKRSRRRWRPPSPRDNHVDVINAAPLTSAAIWAASAIQTGSLPKIWAQQGSLRGRGAASSRLFLS